TQADDAGVTLRAEVASNVPTLDIDPARIRQVLENLIANALRHTPRGGQVWVRCSVTEARDSPQQLTLSVEDTGVGISPEDLPHIFDRFAKAHDSRGMGLGLTIAKNLVAAHGGRKSV